MVFQQKLLGKGVFVELLGNKGFNAFESGLEMLSLDRKYRLGKRNTFSQLLPSSIKKMKYYISPFPEFESIFNANNSKEKFVFSPLASIEFDNDKVLSDKKFHFISVWDTGSYEKEYFNEYRLSERVIRFKFYDNKYSYPTELKFPFLDELESAYKTIENNFNENIDFFLKVKSYEEFSGTLNKGGDILFSNNKKFDRWDAGYYFEKITTYLYTKKKFERFNKIHSRFTYPETLIGLTKTKEEIISEFHTYGTAKEDIVKNILDKPDWLQFPENLDYNKLIFIGSVSEFDFTNGTAEIYLFWDKENDYVYQISQWT